MGAQHVGMARSDAMRANSASLSWLIVVAILVPSIARADAVDDAFVRGNQAAQAGAWNDAVSAYEDAVAMLSRDNALLSFNLGTSYAELGELGRAMAHLSRAASSSNEPSPEVLQSARENLERVQRRIELQSAASGAMLDPPPTSWEAVMSALGAPVLAWLALLSGWAFLVLLLARLWRRSIQDAYDGVIGAILMVLAILFIGLGSLHWAAIRSNRVAPKAIVIENMVPAREGPGHHRKQEFVLQGGSRVRIVANTPGWSQVRLSSGVEGWIPQASVGLLEGSRIPPPSTLSGAPVARKT